jgi:lipid II:glycine glycyltransferase (peptidoglycan interpeptide bridge formation enzyme)
MYSVRIIENTSEWESFLKSQKYSSFVQSSLYGEFYKTLGENYWILGIYKGDILLGGSLILTTHAKRGNFFYLPYGPILDYKDVEQVTTFFDKLKKLARKEKMDFIRISPFLANTQEGRKAVKTIGFQPAPMHVLAENSWLLDLSDSEERILANMKKNHRNLIRRCEREGVKVEERTDDAAIEILHTLLDETEKRHNFTRFSRKYINAEFEKFKIDKQASIFISYLPNGEVDSAAIIMFYGNMAVYRHSGSYNKNKKLPTSYLVQWRIIQEAKKRGIKWYNFWGVEPQNAHKNHPYAGIGHFKRGFGGFQEDLLHCQDLPLTKKYWFNWIIETLRKKKRGF